MSGTFLVTGATGTTAAMVATQLRENGANVPALVRDEAKAAALGAKGIVLATGDFEDENLSRDISAPALQ